MSTRASLYLNPGRKAKEIAESVYWIPVLWVPLFSVEDVESADSGNSCVIKTSLKSGVKRALESVPFLSEMFDEFESFEKNADFFYTSLGACKEKTVGMDVMDHIGMGPDTFFPSLIAALTAIGKRTTKCSFVVPAKTVSHPFTKESVKFKRTTLKGTRAVLCEALSLDPMVEEEEYQLMGNFL